MRQSTRQKTTYFFWLMYLVIIIYYRRIILKIFMHIILCTVTEDGIFKLIFNICSNHHKKATKESLSRILSLHIFHQTWLHTIAFAVVVLMIYKKLWPLWNNKHVPTLKCFSFCVCTESPLFLKFSGILRIFVPWVKLLVLVSLAAVILNLQVTKTKLMNRNNYF